MKFFTLFAAFFLCTFNTTAQNQPQTASVENSLFGVQTGFLGIWVHNETKLSNSIVLRSEIGLDAGIFGNSYSNEHADIDYVFAPVLTVEPRWYYNLEKRLSKGKSIDNNNGNFWGLRISFNPDLFVISNIDEVSVPNQLFIIPKWGIKRGIGKHFTYEVGIGAGYHHLFKNNYQRVSNDDVEIAVDLHLRIGYTF